MGKKHTVPKVSIIIAMYNCAKYLPKSIESILSQTYSNLELIMCDDKSSDETLNVALNYQKKYPNIIKVLSNETNMRAGATRNRCIENSTGEYIAIQDADDYSDPNRIAKEVELLENNKQFAFASTAVYRYNENGIWGEYNSWAKEPKNKDFLWGLPYVHPSSMFRTEVLKKVGCYRVANDTNRTEDFDLFLRLHIAGYSGINIDDKLYYYNENEDAYMRRKYRYRIDEFKTRLDTYKKLKLMPIGILFSIKPLIVGLVPRKLQYLLRKKSSKKYIDNSKPQRILQVISKPHMGGVETMLMNVYRNIDKTKYQFDFTNHSNSTGDYEKEIIDMGGTIHNIKSIKQIGPIKYVFQMKRLVKQNKYNIVHSHISINNSLVLLGARLGGAKIRISHAHTTTSEKPNTLPYKIVIFFMKLINKKVANVYCACGELAGTFLYGDRVMKKNKVLIINNAIEIEKFKKYFNKKNEIKNKFNLPIDARIKDNEGNQPIDKKIIGHIGRFTGPVKNHQFILNIAELMKEQNKIDDYMFLLVGTGEDVEKYKKFCMENELNNYVKFYGISNNIPELMQTFDYLLLPSLYEGLPVVIIEAQAAGISSIVSSKVTTKCDLGLNLVNFYDIDEKDMQSWIEQILKQPAKIDNYSLIQEKIHLKKYDVHSTVDVFCNLYSKER